MLDAKSGEFKVNREDEVISGTLVCADGEVTGKT
jgi:NAD(P) transhydrogenase subunit alpha